ncbi:domain-containing protein 1 [Microthyrium microscopicum]|uniref:Domain-containing protein 1 n=1 Tax=Microthyrium microscopicum TaxID=703497 RepID=A0A6A6UMK7_9PEZI|nr:domain-containing protein 1 [Microthyrium microscopicum]
MSTTLAQSNVTFIDTEASLLPLLDSIANLGTNPPSLYIDLEGIALGRHGSISILSLYIAPTKNTYLIDIHSLGEAAFSTTIKSGTSLKTVLESSAIPKVVFDIRNDSDALFSLFQISVDGIKDLQLMELASRGRSRKFVSGLAKCIEKDSPISAVAKMEWRATKERGCQLFAPEKGGSYEVFNERPLKPEIMQYCKQDVELLPGLYGVYNAKLRKRGQAFWRVQIRETTKDRIKQSQSPSYDGQSNSKAFGWDDDFIDSAIESWNDDIMMEAMGG